MHRLSCAAGLVLAVLVACGGGGGGGGNPGPTKPEITAQPLSLAVLAGHAAQFAVTASGDALTYEWYRDDVKIDGASAASYSLASPQVADSGARFKVKVTNGAGSATSDAATLTVNPDLGDASANFVATWSTATQTPKSNQTPPTAAGTSKPMSLAGTTLRQVVHLSIGGSRFRLQLSNRFGEAPLQILAAHLARTAADWTADQASGPTIVAGTDHVLTFGGTGAVTIPAGQEIWSDSIQFADPVPALQELTVSLVLGTVPTTLTMHPGSRTTSYVVAGDHAADTTLTTTLTKPHWWFISGLEAVADADVRTVAVLGDSLTDGRGTTDDHQNRWTDLLAERLAARHAGDPATYPEIAVVNLGIGGNALLQGWSPYFDSGIARFDHDIAAQRGVKWVIVFMGVNDILYNGGTAAGLEAGYQQVIKKAHDAGLKVFGATITPFAGNGSATSAMLDVRTAVNAWIRTNATETTGDRFDGLLEFSDAVKEPASSPERLLSAILSYTANDGTGPYTSSDNLHFNPTGYANLANAIDLTLFQ